MVKINLPKYLEWLEKRNLSPETIRNYNWALQKYGTRELDTNSITVFLQKRLIEYKPLSLHSLRNALVLYTKFAKIEIEWEMINRLIPTIQQKYFLTINKTELELLKQVKTRTSSFINQRNNLILDFLFWTGIRVKELINIRHCDYQSESQQLQIRGKGNKIRWIPIPDFLAKYFNGNSDYLFLNQQGQKISGAWVWMMIRKRTRKAGLTKYITPHTFRRSFATFANNQEIKLTAIQKFLGHSRLDTTIGYIHNSREELYQEYSKLWKISESSPKSSPPPPPLATSLKNKYR